jgi:hypothetical protein
MLLDCDCVYILARKLDPCDIITCTLVCKDWYNSFSNDSIWKDLIVRDFDGQLKTLNEYIRKKYQYPCEIVTKDYVNAICNKETMAIKSENYWLYAHFYTSRKLEMYIKNNREIENYKVKTIEKCHEESLGIPRDNLHLVNKFNLESISEIINTMYHCCTCFCAFVMDSRTLHYNLLNINTWIGKLTFCSNECILAFLSMPSNAYCWHCEKYIDHNQYNKSHHNLSQPITTYGNIIKNDTLYIRTFFTQTLVKRPRKVTHSILISSLRRPFLLYTAMLPSDNPEILVYCNFFCYHKSISMFHPSKLSNTYRSNDKIEPFCPWFFHQYSNEQKNINVVDSSNKRIAPVKKRRKIYKNNCIIDINKAKRVKISIY